MLPHSGTRSRVWHDVVRLGGHLAGLEELRGSLVLADVAVLWDWESWWALELDWRPSSELDYRERVGAFYELLWDAHLTADFVAPGADLSRYPLVVVPSLYLTTPAASAALTEYVRGGGTLVVSYFSGIVDENDTIHPGPFPGALREVLGVEVEEVLPLRAGERVLLDGGARADTWAEEVLLAGADPVIRYVDGPSAGGPAVTRHRFGDGVAWYVSTRMDRAALGLVLHDACTDAGVDPRVDLPADVEVVRRATEDAEYLFVVNHNDHAVRVDARGTDLLSGQVCGPDLLVAPGGVAVVRVT
jgi:beta-galactosidase